MVKFFRQLAAVPFRVIAFVLSILPIFDAQVINRIIWSITHEAEDGRKYLLMLSKEGIERVEREVEGMLRVCPDAWLLEIVLRIKVAMLAEPAGILAEIDKAASAGLANTDMLLYVRMMALDLSGDGQDEIAEKILSRNDLPGDFTVGALAAKGWHAAERGQWEEAGRYADRVLAVGDMDSFYLLKWTNSLACGDQAGVEKHFGLAVKNRRSPYFEGLVAQGWLFAGFSEQAKDWLYQACKKGFYLHESRSKLGAFLHSEDFRRYCQLKESA